MKLTAEQVLDFKFKQGYYSGGERKGVHAKAKFRRKSNPDALVTSLPTYSLYSRLLESPRYIVHVISTILGTLIRYGLLTCN